MLDLAPIRKKFQEEGKISCDDINNLLIEVEVLRNNFAILKQEWKELSVESESKSCYEYACGQRAKWLFTPRDYQYYCDRHKIINKAKWD